MGLKKLITVFIASVLFLTGCQWSNNDTNREGRGTGTVEQTRHTRDTQQNANNFTDRVENRNRMTNDNMGNNRNSNNRQDRYEISEEAARRIVDEIPEIDQAYVLTTRNNAYVAATLDEANTTPNDSLTKNDRNNSSAGMNVRNVNDRNVTNRTVNEGNANNRRQDNHMSNRKGDVESDEVTDAVKNKISDIVQDVDNKIENVYVSTSPDFFNLTNDYVDDFNNGRPVQGFFDQIGNSIERIFPQNKR